MEKEYKWFNGSLILNENWVIIKRWLKWFFFWWGMLRWDKTIPYSSIVAVQFKKAWLLEWFIQLSLKWWSEAKWWLLESKRDENSIYFQNWWENNKKFEEAKIIIEEKISWWYIKNNNSNLDELEKLANLKEKGIISQEEFEKKKKILLDL